MGYTDRRFKASEFLAEQHGESPGVSLPGLSVAALRCFFDGGERFTPPEAPLAAITWNKEKRFHQRVAALVRP
jgi:hypothetical protein